MTAFAIPCAYCQENPADPALAIPASMTLTEFSALCTECEPRRQAIIEAAEAGYRLRRCPECTEEFTVPRRGRGRPNKFCSAPCATDNRRRTDLAAKAALRRLPLLEAERDDLAARLAAAEAKADHLAAEAAHWAAEADRLRSLLTIAETKAV